MGGHDQYTAVQRRLEILSKLLRKHDEPGHRAFRLAVDSLTEAEHQRRQRVARPTHGKTEKLGEQGDRLPLAEGVLQHAAELVLEQGLPDVHGIPDRFVVPDGHVRTVAGQHVGRLVDDLTHLG